MTDNVMAKTVDNAENLLMQIWRPAVKRVHEEVAEMQSLADRENAGITIEPWDYYYYAEKVRRDKYALDEDEVRAYFALDNVRDGIFKMAKTLYGVNFTEMPDAPKYYPEVTVYDVTDNDGAHVAVFMTDYFPRASKRQGAWMEELKGSYIREDGTSSRPIVYNVGNFSRPTADAPALLTLDGNNVPRIRTWPPRNALTRQIPQPERHQRRPRLCRTAITDTRALGHGA